MNSRLVHRCVCVHGRCCVVFVCDVGVGDLRSELDAGDLPPKWSDIRISVGVIELLPSGTEGPRAHSSRRLRCRPFVQARLSMPCKLLFRRGIVLSCEILGSTYFGRWGHGPQRQDWDNGGGDRSLETTSHEPPGYRGAYLGPLRSAHTCIGVLEAAVAAICCILMTNSCF